MITGNESAMPHTLGGNQMNGQDDYIAEGLTIRQHFAAMANTENSMSVFNNDIKLASAETGIDFLGSNLLFWVNVEAKLKIIKADALIKALNNEQ